MEISAPKTPEREELKSRAHKARQNLVGGKKITAEVYSNWGSWDNLTDEDKTLFNDYKSGALQRRCDEADAAYGWDRDTRYAVQSVAARLKVTG